MSKISEPGYFFIHSGILEKSQIESCFSFVINYLNENYEDKFKNCQFEINVVENKNGEKFGHTYAWTDNLEFYNAFIGRNFDGSERFEMKDDEEWEEPNEDYGEELDKIQGNWADETDLDDKYTRPKIKIKLDPLVSAPAIKYTEEQKKKVEGEFGFLEIFEVKISRKTEKSNSLFTNNLPDNVKEDDILNYFKKFNKDINTYVDKNTKSKYRYPIVKIKNKNSNRQCTVSFSPLYSNTASFVINVSKKVILKNNILFFSQCKK